MYQYSFRKRPIVIRYISFFLLLTIALHHTMQAMQQVEPAASPPSAELAQIQTNFNALEQNMRELEQALPNLQRELEQLETNAHRPSIFEHLIVSTNNQETANPHDGNFQIGIGLYGKDLVNIAAWFAEYGLDWYLFNHFKKFNIENVTENLLEKHEQILNYLERLTVKKSTKEIVANRQAQELNTFFKNECFIDLNIKRALTSDLLSKIIIYIFSNECANAFKHALIHNQQNSIEAFIGWMNTQATQPNATLNNHNNTLTISVSTIISIALALTFFSPLKSLLNFYSDTLVASSRFLECRPHFFDTYFFQLIKRFIILIYFSRQLNQQYQELWGEFIKKNAFALKVILNDYAQAKKQKTPKDIELVKQRLTTLVQQGHAYSFIWWIRFKNKAFSKTNAALETIIALPLFYKAGHYMYNYFYNNTH